MLAGVGILSQEERDQLLEGLDQVEKEIQEDTFPFDDRLEDIHMNIESRLRDLIGPVAGRLHTGRSRNDQVATDLTLYLRETSSMIREKLAGLQKVLIRRSHEHIDTVLPGYTHLQRAQPVRLAHHWLAHVEVLYRDSQRFKDLLKRLAFSPLGAGALAGSTLPLNRDATSSELGFEAPSDNSMDSVASRDGALEFLSSAAICAIHLSRLAEELVLWSSREFAFVELSDAYSTGSSLMPQKKNPDVPELVRAKSGRCIGNLVALLTVLKGLPLTYNRDLQEDKEPVFDSANTVADCLEVMSGAMESLIIKTGTMRKAAEDPMLLATDLAENLVKEGVAFREAHEAIGKLVASCLKGDLDPRTLSLSQLKEFHPSFAAPAKELISLEKALESRNTAGGTAKSSVEKALVKAESRLAED
jgi:argininosuccinate lyase